MLSLRPSHVVSMDAAKHLAAEFVRSRSPSAEVSVRDAELKQANRWTVRVNAHARTAFGESAENWVVEIAGGRIVSCDNESGLASSVKRPASAGKDKV